VNEKSRFSVIQPLAHWSVNLLQNQRLQAISFGSGVRQTTDCRVISASSGWDMLRVLRRRSTEHTERRFGVEGPVKRNFVEAPDERSSHTGAEPIRRARDQHSETPGGSS